MAKQIIKTKQQAQYFVDRLDYTQPLSFDVKPASNKRTLSKNAKFNIWYNEIDKQLCLPVGTTRCECKLYFGVPILRAEDEDFREGYDRLIKNRFTKDEKLELMRVNFPVTSLMSNEQAGRYMETIQHYYAEQMGIILD